MSASACLGLVIKTCHENMDSTNFCSYLCIILAAMQEVVYCKQSCSSLEFPEVSGSTVHAKENSTVSIPFHVNTKKCEMVPDLFILVMKETNGPLVNQCTIRVSTGTCTLSHTSTACRSPSTDDNMLFVKRVTASDEGVYVWRWNEKGSMSRETKIRLDVSASTPATTATTSLFSDDRQTQSTEEQSSSTNDFSPAKDRLFLVNGVHSRTVSVSEDSTVDMVCQSDTWTSTRIISVVDGDRLLAGNEMQSGQLRYIINKTRCEDTGDYRCEFADTTRLFYTETVRLLVPCAPRKKTEGLSPFVVNNDSNGHVSFEMTAYPIPNVKTYKLKLKSIEPIKDRMQTSCASESMKFASIICNITVINVTNADDGAQFMVVFSNDLGELPFTFRIGLNVLNKWQN